MEEEKEGKEEERVKLGPILNPPPTCSHYDSIHAYGYALALFSSCFSYGLGTRLDYALE